MTKILLLNFNISEASWAILIKFLCSIIGMGESLHKVLGQIGSKLWFPWQQIVFSVVFDPILLILAGNEDMHKISH